MPWRFKIYWHQQFLHKVIILKQNSTFHVWKVFLMKNYGSWLQNVASRLLQIIRKSRILLYHGRTLLMPSYFIIISNLDIVSSFMSISLLFLEFWQFLFLRDLTRNPGLEKRPIWILSNIQGLERVRDTKFGMGISCEQLLNIVKW